MHLIDTHSHLHFPAYKSDLPEVLARLRDKNIGTITVGTTLTNSEAAVEFAEKYGGVWASVALHPEHLTSSFHDPNEGEAPERELDAERLEKIARSSSKVVAIGETGLDFHWIDQTLDQRQAQQKQEDAFLAHVSLAQKLDLPLIIHCRDALMRLAEILQKLRANGQPVRGVVHSFSGTWAEAQTFLDLGMHLGVNGIITFKPRKTERKEDQLAHVIKSLPLDRLLLETDAPYLAPMPYRGKRNEPAYVQEVAGKVAEIRRQSLEEIAKVTTENAQRLFRL